MKHLRIVFSILLLATFFFTSCEKENLEVTEDLLQNSEAELSKAPEIHDQAPVVTPIASIEQQGHQIFFDQLGEDDLIIRERLPADAGDDPSSLIDELGEDLSPFELFTALTTSDIPVPASIANTADQATVAASQRSIDMTNKTYVQSDNSFGQSLEERGCYDEGYSGFRSRRCGVTSSFPHDIRICDNGKWTSHIRNSYYDGRWRTAKKIDTWTNVICGLTRMKYQYYSSPYWYTYYSAELQNGIWRLIIYRGDSRYLRTTRYNSSGSFRAYTRFYN